jgi:polynucleotide 5'-kinase involved in rRNA processing
MITVLQETVQPGVVDLAGWIVGLGGLALVVLWLDYLYR